MQFEIEHHVLTNIIPESGDDLSELVIPDGVEVIGQSVGKELSVRRVTFPASLREIQKLAFLYCGFLEEVMFPSGLQTIGGGAFSVCRNLKIIIIPESVCEVAPFALSCARLEEIHCHGVVIKKEETPEFLIDPQNMYHLLSRIVKREFQNFPDLFQSAVLPFRLAVRFPEHSEIREEIQKNFENLFLDVLIYDALDFFTENREFFRAYLNQGNIDGFIRKAIATGKHEFYLELLNFKNDFLDFPESPGEKLKL